MPRLRIVAQNVGAFPAKFELWGYRVSPEGIVLVEKDGKGCFKLESGVEYQPGEYYRYDDINETTEPLEKLQYKSPPHAVGKFHIDTLEWNGEPLRFERPIIMHNPIGMARDWKRGRPSRL